MNDKTKYKEGESESESDVNEELLFHRTLTLEGIT